MLYRALHVHTCARTYTFMMQLVNTMNVMLETNKYNNMCKLARDQEKFFKDMQDYVQAPRRFWKLRLRAHVHVHRYCAHRCSETRSSIIVCGDMLF